MLRIETGRSRTPRRRQRQSASTPTKARNWTAGAIRILQKEFKLNRRHVGMPTQPAPLAPEKPAVVAGSSLDDASINAPTEQVQTEVKLAESTLPSSEELVGRIARVEHFLNVLTAQTVMWQLGTTPTQKELNPSAPEFIPCLCGAKIPGEEISKWSVRLDTDEYSFHNANFDPTCDDYDANQGLDLTLPFVEIDQDEAHSNVKFRKAHDPLLLLEQSAMEVDQNRHSEAVPSDVVGESESESEFVAERSDYEEPDDSTDKASPQYVAQEKQEIDWEMVTSVVKHHKMQLAKWGTKERIADMKANSGSGSSATMNEVTRQVVEWYEETYGEVLDPPRKVSTWEDLYAELFVKNPFGKSWNRKGWEFIKTCAYDFGFEIKDHCEKEVWDYIESETQPIAEDVDEGGELPDISELQKIVDQAFRDCGTHRSSASTEKPSPC